MEEKWIVSSMGLVYQKWMNENLIRQKHAYIYMSSVPLPYQILIFGTELVYMHVFIGAITLRQKKKRWCLLIESKKRVNVV